ncbi:interleukin-15 isoform X2 [Ahaetulla prasina]|uniref:interleukin-15 isoform X2 n=1 Tax=Ahaetulla prasina TaxID=499056 RepID=UPI0026486748|nr:interleukin-15 isoform X2 [Ahaetulla prasina]
MVSDAVLKSILQFPENLKNKFLVLYLILSLYLLYIQADVHWEAVLKDLEKIEVSSERFSVIRIMVVPKVFFYSIVYHSIRTEEASCMKSERSSKEVQLPFEKIPLGYFLTIFFLIYIYIPPFSEDSGRLTVYRCLFIYCRFKLPQSL